ncbi:hypothetical protein LQZ19_15480 [Treponema primitia]|uniref:hypothetical protein n=1 Tax=Treponema primitia TaxID=88058 RepID=UPI00397F6174
MRVRMLGIMLFIVMITSFAFAEPARDEKAASSPGGVRIVQFSGKLVAQLYQPGVINSYNKIGLFLTHPNSNYFDHSLVKYMTERGFTVMVANTRYTDHKLADIYWDNVALDMKAAISYYKNLPGIEKIILIGHSGGGPASAFYQNIAENGAAVGQGPEKIWPLGNNLNGLPKADGLILLDSHLGYAFAQLVNYDPSVVSEGPLAPQEIDRSLDMYAEANGFSATGSVYTDEWKARYYLGQYKRNDQLLNFALGRWDALKNKTANYPDSEPLVIPRLSSRLFLSDLTAFSHTKKAYPLLSVRGVENTVIQSVRTAGIDKNGRLSGESNNRNYADGVVATDIVNFLSTLAIKVNSNFKITADDIIGVDFNSSNTSTPGNLEGVHVPVLIMSMTAHYWIVPSEIEYEHTASKDKTLVYVEGASHGLSESAPKYGDTQAMIADCITNWVSQRY